MRVSFVRPVGFRFLDEGDLLEFWPDCSLNNGWLYEIRSGGWLEQESARAGFLAKHNDGLREYLVVSQNGCLSVLATGPPAVAEAA